MDGTCVVGTLTKMEAPTERLEELARQTRSLRAALARVRAELDEASLLEQELSEKLRALGVAVDDDADQKTTVDRIEVPGLPGQRRPASQPSWQMLKAGVVGAGLTIGLALVVLLGVNLTLARLTEGAPTASAASLAATTSPPPANEENARDSIPPPPPAEAVESTSVAAPPVTLSSAPIPKAPEPAPVRQSTPPPSASSSAKPTEPSVTPTGSAPPKDRGF